MNPPTSIKMFYPIIAAALMTASGLFEKNAFAQEKVSQLGQYQGYSDAVYDGTVRRSDYLTLSDGTRLAYDLILPTKRGNPADQPLPVLFKYTPYLRTFRLYDRDGKNLVADLYRWSKEEQDRVHRQARSSQQGLLLDPLLRNRYLADMVKCGYAVVVVERPGTGASFGRATPSFESLAKEANDILNWIAAQPWSNGRIGMYGDSWQGQTQLAAASTGNTHLKTIVPVGTWIDNYSSVLYPGGVLNKAFLNFFTWTQKILSSEMITPVDQDQDGTLLAQARQERAQAAGFSFADFVRMFPFRDSALPNGMKPWIEAAAAYPYLERINRSGIPIYLVTGWFDLCPRDMFLWYSNLTVPKRLLVRPLDHSQVDSVQFDLDYGAELHRWFDYWLKGIDNGIMKEPPVHYYLMGGEKKEVWRDTRSWPLKDQAMTRHYLREGETVKAAPVPIGTLSPGPSLALEAFDAYQVDDTTTTGPMARWTAVNWARHYPDMSSNDARAMSYTTSPLEAATQVIGHPLVHLWFRTETSDLEVFAYLEEVDESGHSTYITEGLLRASHRAPAKAPYDYLGLPYHSYFQKDQEPIRSGKPIELVFDLLPTAYRFSKGKRIRLNIAFADSDNFETTNMKPAPKVYLLRDREHPSFIELPVLRDRNGL
jgi:uncharacterized protein